MTTPAEPNTPAEPQTPAPAPVPTPAEVFPPRNAPPAPANVFTPEAIAAQQAEWAAEKDAMNARLSSQQEILDSYLADKKAADEKAAEAAAAQAAAEKAAADEEKSVRELLVQKEEEWQSRFASLEQERERDKILLLKERQLNDLRNYRQKRITEEEDNIEPNLLDLVNGNSVEEIEASIVTMKEKSAAIVENARKFGVQARAASVQQAGVGSTGGNVGALETQDLNREISLDELRAMPATSPEYQALRKQLGMDQASRNVGLIG